MLGELIMHDLANLNRRTLMTQIALLIGATAIPADAFAAIAKRGTKRFLSPAQFSLLTAVADTIIPVTDTPGAVAVGVPRLLDSMLANWASTKSRALLTGALTEIEALAMSNDEMGFAALSPDRRKALLVEHDKAALKPGPPRTEKLSGLAAMTAPPPVANPGYFKLKDLTIALYYASEVALTKELIYEHVPGQWVPSMKITPETRPFAGVGGPF
jgi:gluconate 2-dehydrogenase gamma chain